MRRIVLGAFGATVGGFAPLGCTDTTPANVVERKIGAGGGQISSRDGVLTILVPAGALMDTVEVSVTPTDDPPEVFGAAYRVRPNLDLAIAAEVTYLTALPGDAAGARVVAIHRRDFETTGGFWRSLPRTEVDLEIGLVGGLDQELSPFYALAVDGTTSGSESEGGSPDSGGSGTSGTETGDSDDTSPVPLSHAVDIQPLWTANCAGATCHDNGQSPAIVGDAYAAIVDQFPALASVPYVTPGDSARSYIMHKLAGTHTLDEGGGGCGCNGSGSTMPPTAQLSSDIRELIRAWIDQGALP